MDRRVVRRVVEKLAWLAERADEFVHQPLHGEWAGCFKLRVGDWRVVYSLENCHAPHRRALGRSP
ncbi:MAG: hypothetical protein PVTTEEND_001733 [Candidatus Fervidibacter sp.]|jgi:hypothetical protein